MRIKTAALTGSALDWAVARIEDEDATNYSTTHGLGGPIMDREGIGTFRYNKLDPGEPDVWGAHKVVQRSDWRGDLINIALTLDGPTRLIAAMRCHVSANLGDEVEIPDELVTGGET